jgi:hypothetical protein
MSLKVALSAVGACLAMAGCVASDPYYSSYPDASLAPGFGSATLASGQDHFVVIGAGGGFNAAALSSNCRGYIYGSPDYIVQLQAAGTMLVAAGARTADVTLVVIGPSGEAYCSSERGSVEADAFLTIRNARPGRYAIWFGTPSPGTIPEALLGVALVSGGTASSGNAAPPRPTTMLN